jgi:hypothetical protein
MRKVLMLAAMSLAAAVSLLPTSAQAWCCHWHHVHYWHHCCARQATLFAPIDYVTSWWEHPYYYWSPYTVVDHYTGAYGNVFIGDPILVHRETEVGPFHYKPVVW